MSHAIQVIPSHSGIGLTSCIIGLFYAFHRQGINVTYYSPVDQIDSHIRDVLQSLSEKPLAPSINITKVDS